MIGGAAGTGIETCGELVELMLKRSGYEIFSIHDYMSRVRGGHNFTQIRFADYHIGDYKKKTDFLLAIDEKTISEHADDLLEKGILIADDNYEVPLNEKITIIQFPFADMAKEIGNPRVATVIMAGVFAKAIALSLDICNEVLKKRLKSADWELNLRAFAEGYASSDVITDLAKPSISEEMMLINGAEAAALGAIAGGIGFYSAYPMTPSTSIMSWLSAHDLQAKIVVEQAEDEIAAINMALGASYAGARAMTGTSGGGFALMTEALSLSAVMELPLVILLAQRPGPATGLPTRTEQSDLMFALHAGHGEFPRFIAAIKNPLDAFTVIARAFNLAEKYQVPVLVLTDQHLSDSKFTIPVKAFESALQAMPGEDSYMQQDAAGSPYRRYDTAFGAVSPRLFPGNEMGILVAADSHEHTEDGHITEDMDARNRMNEKRLLKLELLRAEIIEPEYIGRNDAETVLVCWGSSCGAVKEAIAKLADLECSVAGLIFGDIWPLPVMKLQQLAERGVRFYFVEQNATGQFERLVRAETGILAAGCFRKYDGRPLNAEEIVDLYISRRWKNA